MKRPAHLTLVDADRYSALVSRCTEQRERAEKAEARIEADVAEIQLFVALAEERRRRIEALEEKCHLTKDVWESAEREVVELRARIEALEKMLQERRQAAFERKERIEALEGELLHAYSHDCTSVGDGEHGEERGWEALTNEQRAWWVTQAALAAKKELHETAE